MTPEGRKPEAAHPNQASIRKNHFPDIWKSSREIVSRAFAKDCSEICHSEGFKLFVDLKQQAGRPEKISERPASCIGTSTTKTFTIALDDGIP